MRLEVEVDYEPTPEEIAKAEEYMAELRSKGYGEKLVVREAWVQLAQDAAMAFAMYADTNNLSFEEGERLAQDIAEEVETAAEERYSIPGIRHKKEIESV